MSNNKIFPSVVLFQRLMFNKKRKNHVQCYDFQFRPLISTHMDSHVLSPCKCISCKLSCVPYGTHTVVPYKPWDLTMWLIAKLVNLLYQTGSTSYEHRCPTKYLQYLWRISKLLKTIGELSLLVSATKPSSWHMKNVLLYILKPECDCKI